MVKPNDSLDLLVRERVRSVYVPEKDYPMFPPSLSQNHFSLLPSKINYALTYIVKLDDSGKVESYEITPSMIDHVKILSYSKVDSILATQDNTDDLPSEYQIILRQLNELAMKRKLYRQQSGAVMINLPYSQITINNETQLVEVTSVNPDLSPSRSMIAEFMILAGEITAHFAQKNQIPIPYRCQKFRAEINDKEQNHSSNNNMIKNILHNWDLRSKLCSAQFTEIPKPHQSLSLLYYCQVTSPIRRYMDLLVHYQIKAYLRGDSLPFQQQTVKQIIIEQEIPQMRLSELMNQSQRYWVLKYLEQLKPSTLLKALVLQIQYSLGPYGALVLLEDLGYETSVILKRNPIRGETILLSLLSVDAFHNSLNLEEYITSNI